MKCKHSSVDSIDVIFLKRLLPSLLVPLALLFSTILKTENYPQKFKQAVVLPLYKGKGSHSRIMNKIEEDNLLDDNQHGFRKGRSCETAITVLSQTIFNELDKLNVNLVVVIANFLFHREISIKIKEFVSSPFKVNRGIGQGTVNGPNLFMLFFNAVSHLKTDCHHSIFADDVAIYIFDKNVKKGLERLAKIMDRLDNWCNLVGLSISYKKLSL